MEEIKVGEFVRTKKGDIYKFLKIDKNKRLLGEYFDDVIYVCSSSREINKEYRIKEYQISKHSFNIEDLVQKGDFVNGYEVDDFDGYDEEGNYFENDLGISIYDDANMDCIVEYRPIRLMKIKSIVTKEHFEAMQYVIKEE